MNLSFTLCPDSIAALPAKGRSAFVRAAILAFGKAAPPSKESPVAASVEPVKWSRAWNKPALEFPDNFDFSSLVWGKRNGKQVTLNSPPWPNVPELNMEQGRDWHEYVKLWRFPDPFPGPLEWHSMGEPDTPLPEHRDMVEPVEPLPVEPLPVVDPAPSQESPPPVAALPVDPLPVDPLPVDPLPVVVESPPTAAELPVEPLPGVGVSSNVLEDV